MKKTVIGCALAAGVFVGLMPGQPPAGFGKGKAKAKGPETCERVCLEKFATDYLDALAAHNPFGGLPLGRKVKYTENAQTLELGDGLWNVTTGLGKYRLIVVDAEAMQIGLLGTVLANDRPATLALRLKLEDRKITEIESLVSVSSDGGAVSNAGGAAVQEGSLPDVVPTGERLTRDQLIAKVNAYYDAMETGNASLVEFDAQCERVENGVRVTNNPTGEGAGKAINPRAINPQAMSCAEQVSSRIYSNYRAIYPRRTPVVDVERQMVFGFFMYQQPGDLLEVALPGRGVYRFAQEQSQPGFVQVAQMFQFTGGRIHRMEALTQALPYGTPDPYFGGDWRRGQPDAKQPEAGKQKQE